MKPLQLLLALVCLCTLASAEPVSVTLRTEPPGVDVYLVNSAAGGHGMYLGSSDRPVILEERYLQGRGSLDLRLEKEGYFPLDHNVKVLALRDGGSVPASGTLRLVSKEAQGWSYRDVALGLIPTTMLALLILRRGRTPAVGQPAAAASAGPRTLDPMIGLEICGYRVDRAVIRGGMGVLYAGQATSGSGEQAAIKVVDLTGYDETMQQRFFRELTVASKLHHPGIVRTWDYEVLQERYLAIVMEWLPGADLSQRMKGRVLTARETLVVLKPIFEALAYLHERHIVHRDIKPANIFVLPNGMCKLIDFGLARDESKTGLTATGMFLGTPQYCAPEQIAGKGANAAMDQYSLGLVVYGLVTGRPAFAGEDAMQVLSAQLAAEPPLVDQINPAIPHEFALGVARMIAKDPLSRFAGMEEAFGFLARAL